MGGSCRMCKTRMYCVNYFPPVRRPLVRGDWVDGSQCGGSVVSKYRYDYIIRDPDPIILQGGGEDSSSTVHMQYGRSRTRTLPEDQNYELCLVAIFQSYRVQIDSTKR